MLKKFASLLLVVGLGAFGHLSCASKTGTGALIGTGAGAAVGAGVGAIVGGGQGAVIGGTVGAVTGAMTGAAIGSYMDKQQKEIEQKVESANVERVGDDLIVRFSSGILFDVGKADLKAASKSDLNEFAKVLTQYPATNIQVEGHTDSTGSKELNLNLSKARANSVSSHLFSKGVAQSRMAVAGFADERPVADNNTAEGRSANRRVEVKIIPDPEKVPNNN